MNNGNSNYVRGRNFEYYAKKVLEKKGYKVIRVAGSKPIDLIAFGDDGVFVVECKSTYLSDGRKKGILTRLRMMFPEKYITPMVVYKESNRVVIETS